MNTNFKILACFTRSYDKHHNSQNLHLIASTVLIRDGFQTQSPLQIFQNTKTATKRKYIIVEVFDLNDHIYYIQNPLTDNELKIDSDNEGYYYMRFEDSNLGYIRISFNKLLKLYSSNDNDEYSDSIKELFTYGSNVTKSKDQIYTQCLFIFNNIAWSNIVFKFKINNINISGGGTTTRHILTSSDIILNNFLNILFKFDWNYIVELGYKTYKNEKILMSGQIPLHLYRSYLDKITEIYNLKTDDLFNKIKSIIKSEKPSENRFIQIIGNNLLIARDIIIDTMITDWYNNKKENFNYMLTSKNVALKKLSEEYDILVSDDLSETKIELRQSGLTSEKLSTKIEEYKLEISNLEAIFKINQEKIENLTKLSFVELFEVYEKYKLINSNYNNYQKFNKYKTLNIRFYSTGVSNKLVYRINQKATSIRLYSHNSVVRSTGNSVYNNNIWKENHLFKEKSVSSNKFILFNEIRKIIENNPTNHNTQLKIEEFLYNYNLNNDNSINIFEAIGRLNKSFKNILIESKEELYNLITNFLKRDLDIHLNESKLNKKDNAYFYLTKILKEISVNFLVSLLLGKVLIIINNPTEESNNCVDLFSSVGKQIIQFYFYTLYKKEQKNISNSNKNVNLLVRSTYTISDWRKNNKDLIDLYNNDLIHNIGALVMDWLREIDLIEIKLAKSSEDYRKNFNMFKATDKIEKLLDKNIKPLNLPTRIPMIVKPNKYKKVKNKEEYGGYLLNNDLTLDELIIPNWRLKTKTIIEEENQVYSAVNKISSIGYKINKDVLNFIRLYDSKFNLTLCMNETVQNILNKLHGTSEELKSNFSYKDKNKGSNGKKKIKLYKWERVELESFQSKKYVEENILALADLFENVHEFFIPVRMDYRGRIYCITDYLNYQSSELAKGLLLFSKGDKILKTDLNAINYLKIFGANCFGNKLDKKSFIERVKWVEDNTINIRNFDNGELLSKAESKILFIAFCFEYNKWLDCLDNYKSTYFESYLPIQLDATCNGYQHLAMLGLNSSLSNHLNLKKSSIEENPDDFYTFISSFLYRYYENKLKEDINDSERESFERLKLLQIQRNVIKKTIMTIPYNASSIQGIKYLRESFEFDKEYTDLMNNLNKDDLFNTVKLIEGNENENISIEKKLDTRSKSLQTSTWFRYKHDHNIKLESLDFTNLYRGLMFVLNDVFPSLKLLTQYLKDIAHICCKLEISIPWTLPTGLVANQSYMKLKDVRIKPLNYSNYTFNLKIADINKLDKDKQIRAFMPNLIHSLDSATLVMLINNYFQTCESECKNIYAIHDCFAVTANNVEILIHNLKMIYISLYANKGYLSKLDKEIKNHIKNHIGNDFDEEKLLINLYKQKSLKFPNIDEVLKEKYDITLIKDSAYIIN